MFDPTKEDLKDILRRTDEGKLQLPDFQRDYVWGDEDVKSLIASVAKGFPVGAMLTLEMGGEVNFKPRLIAGVPDKEVPPEQLLLDGQQRITSLYQAAYAKRPVKTRTPKRMEVERFYYLDMKKAIGAGADLEAAIVGVPADRVVRSNFGKNVELDLSSPEREYAADMFPLNQVFDSRNWFYGWRDYWWRDRGRDVADLEKEFDQGLVDRINRYKMPIIRLDKSNTREAICLVFEKVNVGGKKLDAFELVTAIYAADRYDLREDWNGPSGRRARMLGYPHRRDVLTEIASTDFLQACAIIHTREKRLAEEANGRAGKDLPQVSCKRETVLALPLEAYKKHCDAVEHGFQEASDFLNEQKIVWHKDVPYPPQIVALAATFAILGKEAQTAAAKTKLARWFWSVTLGELYGSSTESRMARDVPELVDWLRGSDFKPRALDEAYFQVERLRSLRSRLSAAYKGLHALLMRHGCEDFISGKPTDLMTFFNQRIDIHHIFPQAWCKKQSILPDVFNSIVNKTPLSRLSNNEIGGDAPSVYLKRIESKHGLEPQKLDQILRTHLIEPEHLRNDDFQAFFSSRMAALAQLVSAAMDKALIQHSGTNETERELEDSAEEEGLELELSAT